MQKGIKMPLSLYSEKYHSKKDNGNQNYILNLAYETIVSGFNYII